jgi:hypothetical protein
MKTRPWTRLFAVTVVPLALASACTLKGFDPQPEPAPTCAVRDLGSAETPDDPFAGSRPPLVPQGWYWQVITLDVRALPPVELAPPQNDQCVPVALHVYATQEGAPSVTVFDRGVAHPVPYDAIVTTPWVGTYFVFAYDPASPRFSGGRAPLYNVTLRATYLNERDFNDVSPHGPVVWHHRHWRSGGQRQHRPSGSVPEGLCELHLRGPPLQAVGAPRPREGKKRTCAKSSSVSPRSSRPWV